MKDSSFGKIDRLNNPLSKLSERKKENMQINKIRDAKEITINSNDTQKKRDIFRSLYYIKLENLEEIVTALEVHDLPEWNYMPKIA